MPTGSKRQIEKDVGKINEKWKKIIQFCIRKTKSVADVQHVMRYVRSLQSL